MIRKLKTFWIAARRLFNERYTYHASALAFTTLLALVPLVSVVVSTISVFPVFNHFVGLARVYIIENFIPTSGEVIEAYLQNFVQHATGMPTIGVIFLFITTGMLVMTIEDTLNHIWQAAHNRKKYTSWFLYSIIFLMAPLIIGFSVFLSSYLLAFAWIPSRITFLNSVALALIPIAINTLIFSMIYIVGPGYWVNWRDGFLGGFVAAVLFELSKLIFAFYIRQFPNYELIYGTLAAIPIFLIWIYISWLIILYGALVTHTQFKLVTKEKHHKFIQP